MNKFIVRKSGIEPQCSQKEDCFMQLCDKHLSPVDILRCWHHALP